MNRVCPPCGSELLEQDGELVPYDERQRGPPKGAHWSQLDPTEWPIGGMWFCSEECRDEYQENEENTHE